MSMSAEVHSTILQFCVDCNIDIDVTISLLREIVDDMNGDGETYDFGWVANEYSRLQERRPTQHAPDVVESAASVSIFPASEVSALEADTTPATTQVM